MCQTWNIETVAMSRVVYEMASVDFALLKPGAKTMLLASFKSTGVLVSIWPPVATRAWVLAAFEVPLVKMSSVLALCN